jgi:hypothetical protein
VESVEEVPAQFRIDADPAPAQDAREFLEGQKEEGHKFGRELLEAIIFDHLTRGCSCGPPTIYTSKEEAEAGRGVLRFYRQRHDPRSIRVLMRKGD